MRFERHTLAILRHMRDIGASMKSSIPAYSSWVSPRVGDIVLVLINLTRIARLIEDIIKYTTSSLSWPEVHTTYCRDHEASHLIWHEKLLMSSRVLQDAIRQITFANIQPFRCRKQNGPKLSIKDVLHRVHDVFWKISCQYLQTARKS